MVKMHMAGSDQHLVRPGIEFIGLGGKIAIPRDRKDPFSYFRTGQLGMLRIGCVYYATWT